MGQRRRRSTGWPDDDLETGFAYECCGSRCGTRRDGLRNVAVAMRAERSPVSERARRRPPRRAPRRPPGGRRSTAGRAARRPRLTHAGAPGPGARQPARPSVGRGGRAIATRRRRRRVDHDAADHDGARHPRRDQHGRPDRRRRRRPRRRAADDDGAAHHHDPPGRRRRPPRPPPPPPTTAPPTTVPAAAAAERTPSPAAPPGTTARAPASAPTSTLARGTVVTVTTRPSAPGHVHGHRPRTVRRGGSSTSTSPVLRQLAPLAPAQVHRVVHSTVTSTGASHLVDAAARDPHPPGGLQASSPRTGWRRPGRSGRTSSSTRTRCGASPGWPGSAPATTWSRSAPGSGSLTLALAETGAAVTAVEVDRHLLPVLRAVSPSGRREVAGRRGRRHDARLGRRCSPGDGRVGARRQPPLQRRHAARARPARRRAGHRRGCW